MWFIAKCNVRMYLNHCSPGVLQLPGVMHAVQLPIGIHAIMLQPPLVASYVIISPKNQYQQVALPCTHYIDTPYYRLWVWILLGTN